MDEADPEAMPRITFFLKQRTVIINLFAMTMLWVIQTFSFYTSNLCVKYIPGNF